MATFIPVIVALVLAVNAAHGLQCYSCNSVNSTSCKPGMLSTQKTVQCGSGEPVDNPFAGPKCYTITVKKDNGEDIFARGCLQPPATGCAEDLLKSFSWVVEARKTKPMSVRCDGCDTDKCNSASKIAGFTLVGFLLATFAFLF